MFQSSEDIKDLSVALAKAQAECKRAVKSASNPHFRSTYAPLHEYMSVFGDTFCKYGLSVVHMPSIMDGQLVLHSRLMHESGQWIGCTLPVSIDEKRSGPQAIGSALTYMKRYALGCLTGIADAAEDDDAEAATIHDPQVRVEPSPAQIANGPISDKQVAFLRSKLKGDEALTQRIEKKFGSLDSIPRREFQLLLTQVASHFEKAGV